MLDLRTRRLAQLAVRYSIAVKPGENIMISGGEESIPFLVELYKEIILQGAHPVVRFSLPSISDFYYKFATQAQLEHFPQQHFDTVKSCQGYIGINTELNTKELSNINPQKIAKRQQVTHAISDYIVNTPDKIRRVTIAFPCISHAQEAEMSLNEWENFVFQSCLIDWKKFSKFLDKINNKFEKGSQVHLLGDNVDLKFSIKGKNSVADKGEENMPGGEIFMAPVRDSLNGWIKFEYPAIEHGKEVAGIYLKFKEGKVIESKADKNEDFLKEMLSTDAYSSYVGEFGVGCNPRITKFTKNLLFDEKISGTIHLALGMAYKQNGGGNPSSIHWDIVKDMRKAKIILDNKVIQENGVWKI